MTSSQRKALADLIQPLDGLSDAETLAAINAVTETPRSNFVTDRGLVALLGLSNAVALLGVLEAVAGGNDAANAAVARKAIEWLKPSNGGIDFGEANTRAFIAQLTAGGLISVEQKAALDALGVTVTRPADVLGFAPDTKQIAEARTLLTRIEAQQAALTAVREQYNASVAAGEAILEQLQSGNLV